MNKKELSMVFGRIVIVAVLIVIGVGFFIYHNNKGESDFPGSQNEDIISTGSFEDSPFGIHPAESGNDYAYARDLGIKWNREGMYLIWEWIDSGKNGKLSFTKATLSARSDGTGGGIFNYDQERTNLNVDDIKMMVNICPFRKGGDFASDEEKKIYQSFVEKTVERYDGDENFGCTLASPDCYNAGDGQYPDSDLISAFKTNPIKYWQTCNQLYDTCNKGSSCASGNFAKKYAEALKLTYEAVKKADPSANVLIAGDSAKDEYPAVFKELKGEYIDIIDYHRFSIQSPEGSDWYNPKNDFDYLKTNLISSGFDISKLRFWMTETGTHSGKPLGRNNQVLSYQSEKQQSEQMFKVYVSALSYGIEKVFWAWSIVEGFQRDCGFFDYTGFVYDGCDCSNGKYACGGDIDYDLGKGIKKLSYYTYKKMVEVLDGSDWNNIQTIQESNGIYVYKFTKNEKSIWVAWNDNSESKTISLDVGSAKSIKITEAIPKYDSGKEVTDYNTAFNVGSGKISNGKLTITLGSSPIYIEESSENPAQYSPTVYSQVQSQTSPQQNPIGNKTAPPSNECVQTCIATGKTPQQCLPQCLCGDGTCGGPETTVNCPVDCKSATTQPLPPPNGTIIGKCPDGVCGPVEREKGTCPADCG